MKKADYIKKINEKSKLGIADDTALTVPVLKSIYEGLQAKEELGSTLKVNKEISSKLAILENHAENVPTVCENDGKKYRVLGGIKTILDGTEAKEYSKEEIADNPKLIAHLIKMGSGNLQEIE